MNPKSNPSNQFAVGVSTHQDISLAAEQAIQEITSSISSSIDLLTVFSAGFTEQEAEGLLEHTAQLNPKNMLGANCIGVIGREKEYYNQEPALVIWAASLPATPVTSFHLRYEQSIDGGAFVGWPDDTQCLESDCVLMALGDPYSFPMDLLLHQLKSDRPHIQVVGGMSSGSAQPGDWSLFHDGKLAHSGATFVAFHGSENPRTLVSQGCRPIGAPMIVTVGERNLIQTLGGRPAVEQLFEIYDQLPTQEQKLLNTGLQMGIAQTEFKDSFSYGDFLIRNVTDIDRSTGAIQIGDFVQVGQTVQFHVRDHQSASLDLVQACDQLRQDSDATTKSALIFSCNGRGPHLFPEPDHDPGVLAQQLGTSALAGFFAAGEIGPVAGTNFVHGYTASAVIFS